MVALRSLVLWVMLLTAPVQLALGQSVAVPPLTGPVVDEVGVLSPQLRGELEREVVALKREKGSEIAVLIISTTKPEEIEQFSIRVVDSWKLGRKGVDDGVLLLVALNDRRVRIEVGRGLEGDIPDVKAFRIIDEVILKRFKQGDVPGGIQAGVQALDGLIRGVDLPPPPLKAEARNNLSLSLTVFGVVVGEILQNFVGLLLGAVFGGLITCLIGSLLLSLGWAVALGVLVTVLMLFIGAGRYGGGSRYGSPWNSSGSRGSFGGGSFGGGGGSFGSGGSFSGGGASGRW